MHFLLCLDRRSEDACTCKTCCNLALLLRSNQTLMATLNIDCTTLSIIQYSVTGNKPLPPPYTHTRLTTPSSCICLEHPICSGVNSSVQTI